MKKVSLSLPIFIFLLILIPFVSSAQVVQVQNTPQPEQQSGWFSTMKAFFTSPIFWGGLFLLILIAGVVIVLAVVIAYIIRWLKIRNNLWLRKRDEFIKMCSVHSRFDSSHWLRVTKNPPVRLVRLENKKPVLSKPIGHYRGDFLSHEGHHIIAINLIGVRKFWWLPFWMETDVIVIPHNKTLGKKSKDKNKNSEIPANLPTSNTIVQFNSDGEVLLWAEGISRSGEFYTPIVKDKNSQIIDLSFPVYTALKDVALGDYLYEQTEAFGTLAKKGMEINPTVRALGKLGDTNQTVDIPNANDNLGDKKT